VTRGAVIAQLFSGGLTGKAPAKRGSRCVRGSLPAGLVRRTSAEAAIPGSFSSYHPSNFARSQRLCEGVQLADGRRPLELRQLPQAFEKGINDEWSSSSERFFSTFV
jgi:hypothetical protein